MLYYYCEAYNLREGIPGWREAVRFCVWREIPVPAMAASLAYFDAYRRERGPARSASAACPSHRWDPPCAASWCRRSPPPPPAARRAPA
ncbi:MAG: hypothetical protein ACE5R4_06855 [Armatimonadota bacterium]